MEQQWVPIAVIGSLLVVATVLILIVFFVAGLASSREDRRRKRIAAIEAELDEKSEQMRSTIFQIASALQQEGHRARKEMVREAFIHSGRLPDE